MEHTSQSLSQSLWDAGFIGEHEKVWHKGKVRWYLGNRLPWENDPNQTIIPTYTFSELWRVLPCEIKAEGYFYYKFLTDTGTANHAMYLLDSSDLRDMEKYDSHPEMYAERVHESPAEAIGLLLLWLIEEKLLEVE